MRQTRRLLRDLTRHRRPFLLCDDLTATAIHPLTNSVPAQQVLRLPNPPRPVPDIELSTEIRSRIENDSSDLLIVAGGGTLTDLGKHAALAADVPLIVVPTAPSVDAYTSAKSALRIDGYHRTPASRVPDAIIVIPEVIEDTPTELIFAGVGDVAAKLIARHDWEISSLVTGEAFDRVQAEWAARSARRAVAATRRYDPGRSALTILDSLLVTGLTMQAAGSSRPAASSEHTLAHLWEIAVAEQAETPFRRPPFHGELVTFACRVVAVAYRWIAEQLSAGRDAEGDEATTANGEAEWRERVPATLLPFIGKMDEEYGGTELTPEEIHRRRERIKDLRAPIAEQTEALVYELSGALDAIAGCEVDASLPDQWIGLGTRWVRRLRDRWSLFHLAFEMGWEDELIAFIDRRIPAIRRTV